MQTIGALEDVLYRRFEHRGIDRTIVDDESLGEIAQVRRRVPTRPDSGGAQRRVGHRRDRSLSIRAGNVQRTKRTLGMAERLAESRDVVEAQLDAEVREETIESGKRSRSPVTFAL
jgi:hypothetical protein